MCYNMFFCIYHKIIRKSTFSGVNSFVATIIKAYKEDKEDIRYEK